MSGPLLLVLFAGVPLARVARIRTLDWADDTDIVAAGDGDLVLRGGDVYVVLRARNRSRLTPYVRIGYARYWSDFAELPDWPGRFEVSTTRGWTAAASSRPPTAGLPGRR